jgi:hypothetical protein
MGPELQGALVASAFSGQSLEKLHIRIATPTASPQIVGGRNLGRWDVTVSLGAVTMADAADNDEHDNLVGLIEAYVLQGNSTLSAALATTELGVDNVTPSDSREGADDRKRMSAFDFVVECYLK